MTIVSVVLYGRAIVILGASAGAAFGARVPVFAIPLLGEWPSSADWAGIVVIATGVFLATGGEARLRRRSRQSRELQDFRIDFSNSGRMTFGA